MRLNPATYYWNKKDTGIKEEGQTFKKVFQLIYFAVVLFLLIRTRRTANSTHVTKNRSEGFSIFEISMTKRIFHNNFQFEFFFYNKIGEEKKFCGEVKNERWHLAELMFRKNVILWEEAFH